MLPVRAVDVARGAGALAEGIAAGRRVVVTLLVGLDRRADERACEEACACADRRATTTRRARADEARRWPHQCRRPGRPVFHTSSAPVSQEPRPRPLE